MNGLATKVYYELLKNTMPSDMPRRSSLHLDLAGRICAYIHEQAMVVGERLNENRLAEWLGVSRTPVRAALDHLATQGYVEHQPNRGMTLRVLPPAPASAQSTHELDDVVLRLARDRHQEKLPEFVSENDLMHSYGLTRVRVREALEQLANLGVVERKLASGWRFLADVWDRQARQESYQFRLMIEPAAICLPGFALSSAWIDEMRERHLAFLHSPWAEHSSIAFFEMNAAFHLGVTAGSSNRYLIATMERQNLIRRLRNYDWRYGQERVEINTREHLNILDDLAAGDTEMASLRMRRHLEGARDVRIVPDQK